jgi:hypothetical protein
MSATLYYRVVKKTRPRLPCTSPSRFSEIAAKVTGQSYAPWRFDDEHLSMLRGAVIAGTGIDDTIEALIHLIEANGTIEVDKEY